MSGRSGVSSPHVQMTGFDSVISDSAFAAPPNQAHQQSTWRCRCPALVKTRPATDASASIGGQYLQGIATETSVGSVDTELPQGGAGCLLGQEVSHVIV